MSVADFKTLPPNRVRVIVDGRGLCYAATDYAIRRYPQATKEERETAIMASIFERLSHPASMFNTRNLVFAWESETSLRKQLFPGYKEGRTKPPEILEQESFWLKIQYEILPALGFANNISIDGYEGDDIIAKLCEDKVPTVIFSEDGDMYQCLKDTVIIMSIRVHGGMEAKDIRKPRVMDAAKFESLFGVKASKWADVKSIAGCGTDRVPGVPGIGEGKAIKLVNGDPLLKKNGTRSASRVMYDNSQDVVALTRRLVTLPFEGCPDIELKQNTYSLDKLTAICAQFKLHAILTNSTWVDFFNV